MAVLTAGVAAFFPWRSDARLGDFMQQAGVSAAELGGTTGAWLAGDWRKAQAAAPMLAITARMMNSRFICGPERFRYTAFCARSKTV